jgi:hypothetical protein
MTSLPIQAFAKNDVMKASAKDYMDPIKDKSRFSFTQNWIQLAMMFR